MSKHIVFGFIFIWLFAEVKCGKFLEDFCWAGNVIPYNISNNFDLFQVKEIEKQIEILHNKTCLRWLRLDAAPRNYSHYVWIKKGFNEECMTGTKEIAPHETLPNDSRQVVYIYLSDPCIERRYTLSHLVHALGFYPEHQRPDRFCYVELTDESENDPQYKSLYKVRYTPPWLLRFPYDKHSITHYLNPRFIKPKLLSYELVEVPFGMPGHTLSALDIFKIRYKYCGAPHFCRLYPDACALAKLRREGNCDAYFYSQLH